MTLEEKKEFETLTSNVERILYILESDSKTNTKGLVELVHNSEHRLNKMELENKQLKSRIGTYGVIGGSIISFLVWLGQYFITKD